jgi:multidrug efflux pump subunit AcrA (membrane-fusion protein)
MMHTARRWFAGPLIVAAVLLPSCASPEEEAEPVERAATLEEVQGSDVPRIVLTEDAVGRLDIQESEVARDRQGTLIPYAAVFYTATGDTWTYTNPEPLTFVRVPIVVDRIEGDRVFLSDGPPVGTEVVTQGSAELYGTETGVEE